MKSRTRISPVITMMAIAAMACIGFFSSNCERIEPERVIIIKASEVSEVTRTSCTVNATLIDVGPSGVSQHGFCWSLTPDPADAIDCTRMGSKNTKGKFGGDVTGLAPGTSYHLWAYASQDDLKVYGKSQAFSTLSVELPVVQTESVTAITSDGAYCGGNILSNGGAEVTARGVCWNTSANPTIEHAHTTDGSGAGKYGSDIPELISDTKYYVRAYATNSVGTGYGNQQEFRTLFNCGTQLVDKRDGQMYLTVSIGEQCWMAENLNIGDPIVFPSTPGDNVAIEKYCYDDVTTNCDTYGGQYTWDEMMQYTMVEMTQGVCPDGWHIPSDHEWKIMERVLGMTVEESDATHWRGNDEGGKLKAAGTSFWNTPNEGATNSSLFTALPSGFLIHDGSFSGLGSFTVFWTSTPILETQAWYRMLDADHSQIYRIDGYRPNTTPVRCVKD